MKILIVEDDRNCRAMLFEFLNLHGHDMLAVSDALHAVALLSDHAHEIGLVLLDLKMPRMGGDQLMDTFAYWSKCTTRFLIVSGAENLEQYQNHPKLAGILHKPFQLPELLTVINAEAARQKEAKGEPVAQ